MECWEMYIGLWPVLHSFFFCLLTYFISVTLREGLLFWLLVLGAVCAAVILLFDIFYFYDKFWKRATPEFPGGESRPNQVPQERYKNCQVEEKGCLVDGSLWNEWHEEKSCQTDVDVTLDRDTAHHKLKISDDAKEVQWIEEGIQCVSKETNHFDTEPFVLGNIMRCWRSYWCVDVEGKEYWVLGVAADTSSRKGQLELSPSNGFWVIRVSNGRSVKVMTEEVEVRTDIPIPTKVGIYLDYEEKEVSFYNAVDGLCIYTFKIGQGSDRTARPLFSPWSNDSDKISVLSIK
nr:butyrophilin subfamily 1 member A1-like isoform X3 [Paramormyrops kingsleyae]